jgi:hypothetical protein
VSDIEELPATDLVWGCGAIGKIINRNNRQTFHLLESGALPTKKVGHRWVASCRRLASLLVRRG